MNLEIDRFLDRARRRHRWVEATRRGAIGLAAGGAAAIALRLAGLPLPWAAIPAGAGLLVAAATRRRPEDVALADRLDRAAGLGSALTAAVEFGRRQDPWAAAQRATVAPHLDHLDLAALLPWHGRGWGVVAAALMVVLFLPSPPPPLGTPPPPTQLAAFGRSGPTGAASAPRMRPITPSAQRGVAAPHGGGPGETTAAGETAKGLERQVIAQPHAGGGGGRGGGLGDAPATGPLLAETARPAATATGNTVAVATRGRGILPTPTATAPLPAGADHSRLAPDPVANLPLHRQAAVAHYFTLLHPTPKATP